MQLLARLMQQSKDNPLRDDAIARLGAEIETIALGFATASDFFGDRADPAQMIDVQVRLVAFVNDPPRPTTFVDAGSVASLKDQRQISRFIGTLSDVAQSLGSIVEAALDIAQISRQHNDRATHHLRVAAT